MDENRDIERRRTLKSGQIIFNNQNSVIDCRVRNMSEKGARLEVESMLGIPDEFDVVVGEDGDRRQARAVWRRGNSIGVSFG